MENFESARNFSTLHKKFQGCGVQLNFFEKDSIMEFWRQRLGFMSKKGLQAFLRNTILHFKGTHQNPFVGCLASKLHRVSIATPKKQRNFFFIGLH